MPRAMIRLLPLVIALTACAPIIPFHFAETAETLGKKQASLTIAGGGGDGANGNGNKFVEKCCGGGAVRVRVGVGHAQEVGVEGSVVGGGDLDSGGVYLLGKLSYKLGLTPNVALLAGTGLAGGASRSGRTTDVALGADLALVLSTNRLARVLRLYSGARFSFIVPVAKDPHRSDIGAPTQAFVVPLGLSVEPTPSLRLYFEGAFFGGFSEPNIDGPVTSQTWYGGYGTFALAFLFR
jgi:hypothetical protein